MTFSPFDPDRLAIRHRRFRAIPVRMLIPNLITLLALCAGLTAIRLAFEDKLEWALAAIVFAAALDGLDGRVARLIKGQSRFGAELDSLADFVNFGCAPGLIVYLWGLHDLGNVGWICAMVFAICGALRLARFNVMIDDPNRPLWSGNFFTGVPAPAGALVVMLPIYVQLLGGPKFAATITLLYTLAIAFLMVSQVPVFSGKRVGKRVPPEMVLPVFVLVVLFIALVDRLSVVGAVDRDHRLSRLPAARLGLLQGISAQGRDDRGAGNGGEPMCRRRTRCLRGAAEDHERPARLN